MSKLWRTKRNKRNKRFAFLFCFSRTLKRMESVWLVFVLLQVWNFSRSPGCLCIAFVLTYQQINIRNHFHRNPFPFAVHMNIYWVRVHVRWLQILVLSKLENFWSIGMMFSFYRSRLIGVHSMPQINELIDNKILNLRYQGRAIIRFWWRNKSNSLNTHIVNLWIFHDENRQVFQLLLPVDT